MKGTVTSVEQMPVDSVNKILTHLGGQIAMLVLMYRKYSCYALVTL